MSIGGFVLAQVETPDAAAYVKALSQEGPQAAGAAAGRTATFFLLTGSAARRREVLARLAHV